MISETVYNYDQMITRERTFILVFETIDVIQCENILQRSLHKDEANTGHAVPIIVQDQLQLLN